MLRLLSRKVDKITSRSGSTARASNNIVERAQLRSDPTKPLFIEDHGTTSYGDFMNRAGQYATAMREKYRVEKGDRVLARVSKTLNTTALYIACLQIGAVYIPVNPAYTQDETMHFVQDSTPTVFVTCNLKQDEGLKSHVSVIDERALSDLTKTLQVTTDVEHVSDGDHASICYTSGTTGKPNGAILTHGGLSANADQLVKAWGFQPNDRNLHALPFYHVHGMYISLHSTLFSHSSLVWRPKFDVDDAIFHLPQATVMMGVPTFFSRMVSHPKFTKQSTKNMRLFVSGSAPLPVPIIERWKQITGSTIVERYGMTEAQVISSNPIDGITKPGTVGPAIDGVQLRIAPNGGIEIKSPSVFAGYWKNLEKTASEFTEDGWFKTGDVGSLDEDGYLSIGGRSKDMIITGGLNVYPKELEDIIDDMDIVKECAVIGSPHPDFGEAVVVVAVPEDSRTSPVDFEKSIITLMKRKVANYKVPKKVIIVKELPRNHITKIQKNVLRDTYKNLF